MAVAIARQKSSANSKKFTTPSRRDIDAIVWTPPETYYAKKAIENNFISADSTGIYMDHFSILTTRKTIEKSPEALKKLLRAFKKADEYTKQNPGETKQILSKRLGIKIEDMEHILMPIFNQVNGVSLFKDLEKEAKWLSSQNKSNSLSDYTALKQLACPEVLRSLNS